MTSCAIERKSQRLISKDNESDIKRLRVATLIVATLTGNRQTVIIKRKRKRVETDCNDEKNPFSFALLGLWHLWARFERP